MGRKIIAQRETLGLPRPKMISSPGWGDRNSQSLAPPASDLPQRRPLSPTDSRSPPADCPPAACPPLDCPPVGWGAGFQRNSAILDLESFLHPVRCWLPGSAWDRAQPAV